MNLVLPSSCFAPILQYALIVQAENYTTESQEHYIKQSFRTRFEIYGANGKLTLAVPVKKWKNHTPINSIEISYDENWQQVHWRSIQSAYSASPYFEFFDEQMKQLIFRKEDNLIARNQFIEKEICSLLRITSNQKLTSTFEVCEPDLRKIIHPKNKEEMKVVSFPKYIQVFEDKQGFLPNLSILDLLFNLGPESKTYLKQLKLPA